MLYNFVWRNSGKSRFPSKLKQQEQAILKATNSFRVQFCFKIAQLFCHFSAGLDIRTNFFAFFNFGEIQISSKNFFLPLTAVQLFFVALSDHLLPTLDCKELRKGQQQQQGRRRGRCCKTFFNLNIGIILISELCLY